MIVSYDFETDETNRELIRSFTSAFPCSCKYTDMSLAIDHVIPWHWHPAFEINYILEGGAIFQAEQRAETIYRGDVLFANANVVHTTYPAADMDNCRHYSIFFDQSFLAGSYGSILETRYLYPILHSRVLPIYKISPDSRRHLNMIEAIMDVADLHKEEPFGYEFKVRSRLCDFWCMLLEDTADLRQADGDLGTESKTLSDRMRPMLEYIADHYGEDVRLCDIARAGDVSERECGRIFSKAIGTSPMSYLNQHRIRAAAHKLAMTDDSISLIADQCGFSSASHFGQVFRGVFECTPREYRGRNKRPD